MSWPTPVDESPVTAHLAPGEQLLWSGRPGRLLAWTDLPRPLLFGGFLLAFAAFARSGPWSPVQAIALLAGLAVIFGDLGRKVWTRRRSWYAVTDQRAILVTGSEGQQVRSFGLAGLADFAVFAGAGGSGTLIFSEPTGPYVSTGHSGVVTTYSSTPPGPKPQPMVFFHIPDVRAVEALLNSYRQGLR